MDVGNFIGDAIRNITGSVTLYYATVRAANGTSGCFYTAENRGLPAGGEGALQEREGFGFDSYLVVPTSYENASASTSVLICITY